MAAARIRGLTFSTRTILGLTPQALRWRLLRRLDPTLFQKRRHFAPQKSRQENKKLAVCFTENS
jgi:hypothetical protein